MAISMTGINVLGKTHFAANLANPFLSYMVLNLEGQGTNGSTSIIDSTSRHTMTANGSAQISTSQYIVGTSSISFVPNSYVTTGTSTDFSFSGDFTVETWLRPGNTSLSGVAGTYLSGTGWRLIYGLGYSFAFNGVSLDVNSSVVPNTWQHLAIVRHGSTVTFYLNGVASNSLTNSSSIGSPTTFYVGVNPDQSSGITWPMTGYINQFRIYKGVAVYTANFTPSTSMSGI